MKKILISSIVALLVALSWWLVSPLFIHVEVDEKAPVLNDSKATALTLSNDKKVGSFVNGQGSYEVKGDLLLLSNEETSFLRFENFESTNGPDLFVVLSPNKDPLKNGLGEMLILKELKGNRGNQNYALKNISLEKYKSVIIYCRAFSRIFGYTNIEK